MCLQLLLASVLVYEMAITIMLALLSLYSDKYEMFTMIFVMYIIVFNIDDFHMLFVLTKMLYFMSTSRDLEEALEMGMDWSLREGM